MAVRQYIGARYVTKIYENSLDPSSAEWEASVNYEPLTLVTFNNGSYLSKKTVPASAGNPSTEPDYWVQTGFYNGQIASLQQQINDLTADIGDLDDLDTTDKSSIVAAINELFSSGGIERIVMVGDSYPDNGNTFPRVAALLPDKYEILGFAAGGASFSKTDQAGYTSYKSILEGATISDPETVDRVIIMGGYNEINITTNIVQGVDDTVTYIHTRFPNASIEYMPVGRSKSASYNRTVQKYDNIAINELKRKNCIVYDNAKWILSSSNMMDADNVHPSTEGYTEMVKYTYDVIVNKSLNVTNSFEIENIGAATGLPFSVSGNLWFNQYNDRCAVTSTNLVLTKVSGSGRWAIAAGGRSSFLDTPNFFINNDASTSAPVNADWPFRQTNATGSGYIKVQSVQNVSGFNACNFGEVGQCIGINAADDTPGVTNMSSEFRMEFSLSDQFPKYPLSWIGY